MLFVLLALLPSGCDYINLKSADAPVEPYVARVYDKYLYLSELQKQYQGRMSYEDSIYWTRNYINVWVQEQLLLHQAEANLPDSQKDFSHQLREYEKSLLQYTYETRLIEQNLDTVIHYDEIKTYYDEHPDDFILNRDIIKTYYVAVWKDSARLIQKMKNLIYSYPASLEQIERFCYDNELSIFHTDTSRWLYFDNVREIVPIQNVVSFSYLLKYNRSYQFYGDNYWYYLYFHQYRLQGDCSPLELEKERVEKVILSRRKEALIKNIRRKIFEDAQEEGAFEIF